MGVFLGGRGGGGWWMGGGCGDFTPSTIIGLQHNEKVLSEKKLGSWIFIYFDIEYRQSQIKCVGCFSRF